VWSLAPNSRLNLKNWNWLVSAGRTNPPQNESAVLILTLSTNHFDLMR